LVSFIDFSLIEKHQNELKNFVFPVSKYIYNVDVWQGVVFSNYEIVKELAESTKTKTGFSVEVSFNDKEYKTGNNASDEFLESKPNENDKILPKWN